jgi:hypothetical protein
MELLAANLTGTRARMYLTGLYDHSRGDAGDGGRVGRLPALLREMRTMAGMVHALVTSAMGSAPSRVPTVASWADDSATPFRRSA